jgi:hypothetical protein
MILIDTLEQLDKLSLHFPVSVRAEFATGIPSYRQEVSDPADLQQAVMDAFEASPTSRALLFDHPITLGELMEQLWRDTAMHSSPRFQLNHPHRPLILGFGDLATRYILLRLAVGDVRLDFFSLLRDLTSENPVPNEYRGYVMHMAAAWIDWGIKAGKMEPLGLEILAKHPFQTS